MFLQLFFFHVFFQYFDYIHSSDAAGRETEREGERRGSQREGLSNFVTLVTLNKGQVAVGKGTNSGRGMREEGRGGGEGAVVGWNSKVGRSRSAGRFREKCCGEV